MRHFLHMTHFSIMQWIRLTTPGDLAANRHLWNLYFSMPAFTACCTGTQWEGYRWATAGLPTCPECAIHYDQALLLRDHP